MHGLLIDRSVASVAASLATAAVVSILFQQTAPFKSQTDLVRLNVVVLDNRTGKPVLDLAAADFTVTEDGRDQKIVHFLAAGNPVERSTSVSADQRAFLFVFGSGYLDGPIRPYDGVTTFIRQELRPGDRVGLLAWNRVTDLTSSHEEVADAVQRLRTMPDNLLTSWLRDQQRLDDLSPQTQAGIDRLFSVAGELPLRSAPALLVGTQEFKQNAPLWGRWNRQFIGWDKLKVIAGIEHLRRLQGEKHLVYVSRAGLSLPIRFVNEGIGLRVESTDDDLRLAVRAAEANVTLHVIHTFGTDQRTGVAFHSSQNLAYLTGGQFTSARSAIEQLKRINEASQSSYVLGYISAKSPDDKYRRVEVAVNLRSTTMIHRRGYIAYRNPPATDGRALYARTRFEETAAAGVDVSDIAITARAEALDDRSAGRQVEIELRVDPKDLTLERVNDKWEGTIDLMILCGDAKRVVIGRLDQQMKLGMDDATYRQALAVGIPYRTTIPVRGVPVAIKVMVYDYGRDRMGSVSINLRGRQSSNGRTSLPRRLVEFLNGRQPAPGPSRR